MIRKKSMNYSYYSLLILGSFSFLVSTVKSSCTEESRSAGVIGNNLDEVYKDSLCTNIRVPPNQLLQLTNLDPDFIKCYNAKLEIEILALGEKYSLCGYSPLKHPITAVSDVQISFSFIKDYVEVFHLTEKPYFELQFEIRDIECLRFGSFHCSNNSCIPESKVCDGIEDCENGDDEVGCETGILSIKGVVDARSKEITWINSKRTSSWGWHENTPRVLLSLFLAGGVTFNGTNYEEELMAKQAELKTSIALLKNPLPNEQLSMFINSLLVTCHNPRHFYGQNLIKRLKEKIQSSTNFTHPLTYLTLCNAKEPWPQKAIEDLSKILSNDGDYLFIRDFQAIAVMAVSCYDNQTKFLNKSEYSDLKSKYENAIKSLKESQLTDGSFGTLHTTSLITQALISSGQELEKDWKLNATIHYLMQELASPHDIVASALTLPILNAKSLSDISKVNCTLNSRRSGYENHATDDYIGPKIRVKYSLYVGDLKDVIHTISLRVPENYTAYEVMKLAETEDSKFTFKYKKIYDITYVYQIGDVTNDPEGGHFWLLYKGQNTVNATTNLFNLSPDELVMQNNEHLVMWYKRAHL